MSPSFQIGVSSQCLLRGLSVTHWILTHTHTPTHIHTQSAILGVPTSSLAQGPLPHGAKPPQTHPTLFEASTPPLHPPAACYLLPPQGLAQNSAPPHLPGFNCSSSACPSTLGKQLCIGHLAHYGLIKCLPACLPQLGAGIQ